MAEKTEGSWLEFATDRPRLTVWTMVVVTLMLVVLTALPSVWPERFGLLNPLTSKDMSYRVREALLDKVASWEDTGDQVYITGLPVAEDTFGVQMFYQMAISAPLAMLVIFLAMWWFFRHVRLITSAMIVAMVAAAGTMALLVISGNTVHIMSSMIPVFIMPIAVLDAVHILSEFG